MCSVCVMCLSRCVLCVCSVAYVSKYVLHDVYMYMHMYIFMYIVFIKVCTLCVHSVCLEVYAVCIYKFVLFV